MVSGDAKCSVFENKQLSIDTLPWSDLKLNFVSSLTANSIANVPPMTSNRPTMICIVPYLCIVGENSTSGRPGMGQISVSRASTKP